MGAIEARDAALLDQRKKEAALAKDLQERDKALVEARTKEETARRKEAADAKAREDALRKRDAAHAAEISRLDAELHAKDEAQRRKDAADAKAREDAHRKREAAHEAQVSHLEAELRAKEEALRARDASLADLRKRSSGIEAEAAAQLAAKERALVLTAQLQQKGRESDAVIEALRSEGLASNARSRRRVACFLCLGLLGLLLTLPLFALLYAFGECSLAAAVRSARSACASDPAPWVRDLACVSNDGCLELFLQPASSWAGGWACSPAQWLVDPSAAALAPPVPASGAPQEHAVWYASDSDLALGCRAPFGCGAAAVGM